MKNKVVAILGLCLMLSGCSNNAYPSYEWNVDDGTYSYDNYSVKENYENVVVVKRTENKLNEEKTLTISVHCQYYDIASMIIAMQVYEDIDDLKDSLIKITKEKLNISVDDYFIESINCIDLTKSVDDVGNVVDKLRKYWDADSDIEVVLVFTEKEIYVEEWDGKTYTIENGSKDNINYESKNYLGINDMYK